MLLNVGASVLTRTDLSPRYKPSSSFIRAVDKSVSLMMDLYSFKKAQSCVVLLTEGFLYFFYVCHSAEALVQWSLKKII